MLVVEILKSKDHVFALGIIGTFSYKVNLVTHINCVVVDIITARDRELCMKEDIDELKSEFQAKLLSWNNIKSKKTKVTFIFIFFGLIGLKVFTTMFTVDWLAGLI
ncbi:hypothetical protein H5203_19325 [Pseudoalteromonas sp. SG41-1]|jgi:hypothetical protein|uniref:Uncharacterized protein n=1 Tax=Pseudoalteromonas neustonica TaxID=1840331 RepID=A0ABY3FBX3_9GAMM|nr:MULTISPECIES: hypothetical protein [Pseudoalteromonas]MBB1507618.1 hypothetical protein [Pseudoalteromonas sp. SG41-1]TVU81486.1 hypothetical protein FQP85_16710 [Pseudoalteromonas neustonica]|tara:strand:+ start:244 stop:561 length:318 start_codon:yes stop_codon:yes gene_type:complete